ncbi:MAG: calcium-binding protein, partial [Pseudomonadota bacterium]
MTITVTNLNDSGAGSLRQAIEDAKASAGLDDIVFAEALAGGTIFVGSVDAFAIDDADGIRINGDADGDGVADITISGDNDNSGGFSILDSRHFDIAVGGYLRLSNIALTGGADIALFGPSAAATRASSIDNAGTVRLENVTISGGTANGQGIATADNAAVIYNRDDATLSANDLLLYDNVSIGGSGVTSAEDGGHAAAGIFNYRGLAIVDRIGVADSIATGGDGAISLVAGTGGDGGSANSIILLRGGSSYQSRGKFAASGNAVTAGDGGPGVSATPPFGPDNGDPGDATDGFAYLGDPSSIFGPPGVTGRNTDDTFTDTNGEIVLGFGGDDVFNGNQRFAEIYGGTGDDAIVVSGDRFVAKFFGGQGVDTIDLRGATVTETDDYNFELTPDPFDPFFLNFTAGTATRQVQSVERVYGSAGADRLIAGIYGMEIDGGGGSDYVGGGAGADTLAGGVGNDSLFGGAGADRFSHDAGVNVIDGGAGADRIDFGAALPQFTVALAGAGVRISGDGGTSTVANVETFVFTDGARSLAALRDNVPTGGANSLSGFSGFADRIDGLAGNDTIRGLGGNDTLLGSAGADRLVGSGGADRLVGGDGADRLI